MSDLNMEICYAAFRQAWNFTACRRMKYQIKLKKTFHGRETTLDWQLGLEQSIVEAKQRLDWKAATSARVVDESGRDVWHSPSGSRRQSLWLWGQVTVATLSIAGLVVVGLLEGA